MTELPVRDLNASLEWYRDRLGLQVVLHDEANGFALLQAGARLALKQSATVTCGVTLHFQVESLDLQLQRLAEQKITLDAPPKRSDEGYQRIFVRDPDGHRIGFFEWQTDSRNL